MKDSNLISTNFLNDARCKQYLYLLSLHKKDIYKTHKSTVLFLQHSFFITPSSKSYSFNRFAIAVQNFNIFVNYRILSKKILTKMKKITSLHQSSKYYIDLKKTNPLNFSPNMVLFHLSLNTLVTANTFPSYKCKLLFDHSSTSSAHDDISFSLLTWMFIITKTPFAPFDFLHHFLSIVLQFSVNFKTKTLFNILKCLEQKMSHTPINTWSYTQTHNAGQLNMHEYQHMSNPTQLLELSPRLRRLTWFHLYI